MSAARLVVCATDFSEGAEHAFEHALFVARAWEAELHLFHAVLLPVLGFESDEQHYVKARATARQRMRRLADGLEAADVSLELAVRPVPHDSGEAPVILAYAESVGADDD